MKRTLAMLVVIAAALGFGSAARATPVTFDLAGVVGWWSRSGDANAAIPGPTTHGGPCGSTSLGSTTPGSSLNCFRYPFSPGSSITVDITGSAVTMLGGTLIVDAVLPIVFGTIVLTTHHETTIEAGFTGNLTGNDISWVNPEQGWGSVVGISSTGTVQCAGPNCGLISMPEGDVFSIHPTWDNLSNTFPAPFTFLGMWTLNAQHDAILASTTAVSAWSNVSEDGNRRQAGFTFGPTLLGIPVPEPGLPALLALGVGARALRARKSGSR